MATRRNGNSSSKNALTVLKAKVWVTEKGVIDGRDIDEALGIYSAKEEDDDEVGDEDGVDIDELEEDELDEDELDEDASDEEDDDDDDEEDEDEE